MAGGCQGCRKWGRDMLLGWEFVVLGWRLTVLGWGLGLPGWGLI